MADNIVASMSATIDIDKQQALNQIVAYSKEAQTYLDKNKITYRFTSDKSDLEQIIKQIEGLSPEVKAGIVLDFDTSEYTTQLEKLQNITSKTAAQLGETFQKSIKKIKFKDILGIQDIKDVFKLLNKQKASFDISKITSEDELRNWLSTFQKLETVAKKLDGQKIGKVSIDKDYLDDISSKISSIYSSAGDIILKDAQRQQEELISQFTSTFGTIQSKLAEMMEGIKFSNASAIEKELEDIAKQIEKVDNALTEAKEKADKYSNLLKKTSDSLKSPLAKAYEEFSSTYTKESAKKFQDAVQSFVGLGGNIDAVALSNRIKQEYANTKLYNAEGFIPIKEIKSIKEYSDAANAEVAKLQDSMDELIRREEYLEDLRDGNKPSATPGGVSTEEFERVNKELKETKTLLESVGEELKNSKGLADTFADHLNEARRQISELQTRLDEYGTGQVPLSDLEAVSAQIEKLKTEISWLNTIIEQNKQQIADLTSLNEVQKKEIENGKIVEKQLHEKEEALRSANEQITKQNKKLEEQKQKITEVTSELKKQEKMSKEAFIAEMMKGRGGSGDGTGDSSGTGSKSGKSKTSKVTGDKVKLVPDVSTFKEDAKKALAGIILDDKEVKITPVIDEDGNKSVKSFSSLLNKIVDKISSFPPIDLVVNGFDKLEEIQTLLGGIDVKDKTVSDLSLLSTTLDALQLVLNDSTFTAKLGELKKSLQGLDLTGLSKLRFSKDAFAALSSLTEDDLNNLWLLTDILKDLHDIPPMSKDALSGIKLTSKQISNLEAAAVGITNFKNSLVGLDGVTSSTAAIDELIKKIATLKGVVNSVKDIKVEVIEGTNGTKAKVTSGSTKTKDTTAAFRLKDGDSTKYNSAIAIDPTKYINSAEITQAQAVLSNLYQQMSSGAKQSAEANDELRKSFEEQIKTIRELSEQSNLLTKKNGGQHIGYVQRDGNIVDLKEDVLELMRGLNQGEVSFETFTQGHRAMIASIKGNDGQVKRYRVSLEQSTKAVDMLYLSEKKYTTFGQRWISGLKRKIVELTQYITGIGVINTVWTQLQRGFEIMKEYDTALTEMNKVSDESIRTLQRFQEESFDLADAIGTTAAQIQSSTADFLRLGESLEQAKQSAQDANILFQVSEFETIDEATDALIAMSAAYKDLTKSEINDVLNNIGNNFPIATDGLASALQKSAATLQIAGNDIYEAAALVTAGNAILQDADSVGTGLKMISLRILGTEEAKEELASLGEEVDDFVVQTSSKIDETVRKYTAVASNGFKGVSVLDESGNYRSTYEILRDISAVYQEILDADKKAGTNRGQALLEVLAGKNRSNVAASILQNPKLLTDVYKAALNSEGSAQEELDAYMESIQAHVDQLKNSWDDLWANEDNRKVITDILGMLKAALDFVNEFGVLKTALLGGGLFAGLKIFTNDGKTELLVFINMPSVISV